MQLKVYEITWGETQTATGSVAGNVVSYNIAFSNQGPAGPAGPQGIQGPPGPSGDVSSSLYSSEVADAVLSTEVGGATPEPASTWKTRTIVRALDTILFPTVPPSISTQKSATLTISGATGVQEVGTAVTRTLTATFNRGRITNGDGTLGPELVGAAIIPSGYAFTGVGISGDFGITGGTTATFNVGNVAVILGNNSWQVSVVHTAGSGAYFDNKGNASTALDGDRAAGTVSASTSVVTGVYPWFYLKSPVAFTAPQFAAAITAGNATAIHPSAVLSKVVASASGTLSVPYNVSGQYLGVAYEQTNTTKTLYYVTALDNGSIAALFSPVASNPAVSTPLWTRGYKFHVSPNPLTNSNPTLELRNS